MIVEPQLRYRIDMLQQVTCEHCGDLVGRYPVTEKGLLRRDLMAHMRAAHKFRIEWETDAKDGPLGQ